MSLFKFLLLSSEKWKVDTLKVNKLVNQTNLTSLLSFLISFLQSRNGKEFFLI